MQIHGFVLYCCRESQLQKGLIRIMIDKSDIMDLQIWIWVSDPQFEWIRFKTWASKDLAFFTNPTNPNKFLQHRRTLKKPKSGQILGFGLAKPYCFQKIRFVDSLCPTVLKRFILCIQFFLWCSKDSFRGFVSGKEKSKITRFVFFGRICIRFPLPASLIFSWLDITQSIYLKPISSIIFWSIICRSIICRSIICRSIICRSIICRSIIWLINYLSINYLSINYLVDQLSVDSLSIISPSIICWSNICWSNICWSNICLSNIYRTNICRSTFCRSFYLNQLSVDSLSIISQVSVNQISIDQISIDQISIDLISVVQLSVY